MTIIGICGTAILAAMMILVVREIRKEHAFLISLAVGLLFFGLLLGTAKDVVAYLQTLSAGIHPPYVAALLKALGIAYLTEITYEICKSTGEGAVSGYVEAVGKAEIIALCVPFIRELTETALRFLGS